MKKFRTASVALLTAGALAFSSANAFAADDSSASSASSEDTTNNNGNSSQDTDNDANNNGNSSQGGNGSSEIGNFLGASDSEKGVWGSEKGPDATPFGWLWYSYTIAATLAAVGGLVVANADNIENAAASFGFDIDLPF